MLPQPVLVNRMDAPRGAPVWSSRWLGANPASVPERHSAPARATSWHLPGSPAEAATWTGDRQSPRLHTRQSRPGNSHSPSAKPYRPKPVVPWACFSNRIARPCLHKGQPQTPIRLASQVSGPSTAKVLRASIRQTRAPAALCRENKNAPAGTRPAGRCGWSSQSVV